MLTHKTQHYLYWNVLNSSRYSSLASVEVVIWSNIQHVCCTSTYSLLLFVSGVPYANHIARVYWKKISNKNTLLIFLTPLQWRHNERNSVSHHQPHDCLLNRLFRRRSKKTSKLRVTGLCAGNSPGTGEFPAQMASYAENVSMTSSWYSVLCKSIQIEYTPNNYAYGLHFVVLCCHDDVIKWKHFPRYWPFLVGNSPVYHTRPIFWGGVGHVYESPLGDSCLVMNIYYIMAGHAIVVAKDITLLFYHGNAVILTLR